MRWPGRGCNAQYLFAEDILGTNRGRMPHHAKVYRNFAAEFDQLQQERVAAFSELIADVRSGAYPENKHVVRIPEKELLSVSTFELIRCVLKANRSRSMCAERTRS